MTEKRVLRSEPIPDEADASYQELYHRSPAGLLSTTGDGVVVSVNDSFLWWTGYARDAVVGRSFTSLLSRGSQMFHDTHYQPLLSMRGWVRELAFDLVRADGRELPILINAVAYRGADDRLRTVHLAVIDATDRRIYERELVAARNAASEAAAQQGQLLVAICQELMTPLSVIGTVANVLADTSLDAGQRELLGMLGKSSEKMRSLAQALVERFRLDSGLSSWDEEPLALGDVLAEVIADHRASAEGKGLVLSLLVAPEVPRISGDRGKIKKIVANLVANAIAFTERGRIDVALVLRRRTGDTATFEVRVSDTGIGIEASRLPTLFEEQKLHAKPTTKRHGLGLSVARRLAELTGGYLSVESELGVGSIFTCALRVPIVAGDR